MILLDLSSKQGYTNTNNYSDKSESKPQLLWLSHLLSKQYIQCAGLQYVNQL